MNTETEPVTVQAAVGSAINATLGLLGLLFKWPQELMSSLLLVSGAWVTVLALVIARPKVAPVVKINRVMDNRNQPRISNAEYRAAG